MTRVSTAGLGALLCALAAASCAGSAMGGRAPALKQGDFGLPRLADLPRNPSFIDADRTLLGSSYTYVGGGFDDHMTIEGNKLRFSPAWNPAGPHSIYNAARAGFHFSLSDYDAQPLVELNWTTFPSDPNNLWIAAANWEANRWDWRQYTGGLLNLGNIAPYQSATKGIYMALVLLGTGEALLDSVRIGPTLWQISVVDNAASVGEFDSLALDSAGEPHISYWDETNDDLKYAYRSAGTWHTEAVDSPGNVGQRTSLALDSADHPHISYFDQTNTDLKYATNDGSGWTFTAIVPADNAGYYTSIALDSLGHPHIAYFDGTVPGVCYASFDGSTWSSVTVDLQGVPDYLSLAIDGANHPHIAYRTPTATLHGYDTGMGWGFDVVYGLASGGLNGSRLLACGPLGTVQVFFYDATSTTAHLGVFDGVAWSESELPFGMNAGTNAALAVDSAGHAHTSFLAGSGGLEYTRFDGSTWHPTIVDNGFQGLHTSLALDVNDKPRISYYDPTNHALRYAEYVN